MSQPKPVLDGLTVVDFTHFIAGPFCSMILADLGAQVLKIEAPDGDTFRRFAPQLGGMGAPFIWVNRNKSSVALNLGTDQGKRLARDLVAQADILVENFSTGIMKRHGLDYETVAAENPGLIYCSISAYGRQGPLARRAGFDPVIQAETGFMSMNGYPDRDPTRTGPAIIDISSGMMAANAILAALFARERQGAGQFVEVAMYDTCVSMLGFHAMNYLVSGVNPTRFGNTSPDSAPMDMFEASDGPIYIACANDTLFRRLVIEVLGLPELAEDAEYALNATRLRNKVRLADELNKHLRRDSRDHWIEKLHAAGIPAGIPRTIEEAFNSPEMAERNLVSRIPHPSGGDVPNIALPLKLVGTPLVPPVAAPLLGQDTRRVLNERLSLGDEAIDVLAADGAIVLAQA